MNGCGAADVRSLQRTYCHFGLAERHEWPLRAFSRRPRRLQKKPSLGQGTFARLVGMKCSDSLDSAFRSSVSTGPNLKAPLFTLNFSSADPFRKRKFQARAFLVC